MTRSYRARRSTQPIVPVGRPAPRKRRGVTKGSRTFTCFRLVTNGGVLVPIELAHSSARMFAFTTM